jgi:hypothetical protein
MESDLALVDIDDRTAGSGISGRNFRVAVQADDTRVSEIREKITVGTRLQPVTGDQRTSRRKT